MKNNLIAVIRGNRSIVTITKGEKLQVVCQDGNVFFDAGGFYSIASTGSANGVGTIIMNISIKYVGIFKNIAIFAVY